MNVKKVRLLKLFIRHFRISEIVFRVIPIYHLDLTEVMHSYDDLPSDEHPDVNC